MKKTNKKTRALKKDGNSNRCFFKAFFTGVAVSFVCILVLCIAVSAFMVSKDDSTGKMSLVSNVITAISLAIGGFVCGKREKGQGIAAAFLCGCACLGLCYGLSTVLDLGGQMDTLNKTVSIAIMLVSPVLGAKIAGNNSGNNHGIRRNTAKL